MYICPKTLKTCQRNCKFFKYKVSKPGGCGCLIDLFFVCFFTGKERCLITLPPVVHLERQTVKFTSGTSAMELPRASWSERSVITGRCEACGWPGTHLDSPLWSLRTPEMQRMLSKAWMESALLFSSLTAY